MAEGTIHHVAYREPLACAEGYRQQDNAWFNEWQFQQALERAQIALARRTIEEGYDLHGPISWRVKWETDEEPFLEFRAPIAKYR